MRKYKSFFNAIIALAVIIGVLPFNAMPVIAEETTDYNISVVWEDSDNAYNLRPDEIYAKITDNDIDGDGTETIYTGVTISKYDNWEKTVSVSSEWENPTVVFSNVNRYSSVTIKSGTNYTRKYSSNYYAATDDVIVDVVWNDNNSANRPENFNVSITGEDGTTVQSTISSSASSASVSGIPYMVNGKINEISISVDSVSGYSAKTGTASSNRGRYAYISFTKSTSNIPAGYSTMTWSGQKLHLYKQSGNEKIAILTAPMDSNGMFTTTDIKNFAKDGINIKAIVNASYFKMGSYPLNVYKTTAYGRIQGMTMNGGPVNVTTAGPEDSASIVNKPYMDLVIESDGDVVAGDMNSWDYHWGENIGFPNEVQAGVTPAGVEVYNGQNVDEYSDEIGYGKITNRNTQTALVKCDDGKFALVATDRSSSLAPLPTLQNFANAYGMSELSVYDSGGSTQLGYNNGSSMLYPVYTGRTLPNVWVIYEEGEPAEDEDVTITISFADIDTNPVDLNDYKIEINTQKGTSVATHIDEAISSLESKGYIIVTNPVPATVDGAVTSYTVEVKHNRVTTTAAETGAVTRKIMFVDEEGTELSDSVTQTVGYEKTVQTTKDQVTGEESAEVTDVSYESEKFAAYDVPEVSGYTPNVDSVPEQDVSYTQPETTYYVKYTKNQPELFTVLLTCENEEVLNKQYSEPVTLKVYKKDGSLKTTMDISENASLELIPERISGFTFIRYDVTENDDVIECTPYYTEEVEEQIELTVSYSGYSDSGSKTLTVASPHDIVINNPDGTEYKRTPYTENTDVTLEYDNVPAGKYIDSWSYTAGEDQSVFTPVLKDISTRKVIVRMDNTNLYTYEGNNEVVFIINGDTITKPEVVTGDVEYIDISRPAEQGKTFKNWNITENENTITFTPVFTDATYNLTANITYKDVNSNPQDLSEYNETIVLPDGETASYDASDTVQELEGKNYIFVDKTQIPSSLENHNFRPASNYSGTTPSKTFTVYKQYSNPYVVIGNGNMQANGCVPTSAAMMLSGYGFDVDPTTLGWYLYSTDNFNGSHGHGGTDLCWADIAKWATGHGTPFKVKYLYSYDDFVDALKSGASVGMAVYYGGGTHARVATGYNNGYTNVYDPIEGLMENVSVSGQWDIRSKAAVDTLSGTSFAALDVQSVENYEIEVDHKAETVESVSNDTEVKRTITYKYANNEQAADDVEQVLTYSVVTEGSKTDLVTNEKTVTTEASEGFKDGKDTFEKVDAPVIPGYTPSKNSTPELKADNPITTGKTEYSDSITYTKTAVDSFVVFNDVNSDPEDLTEYSQTKTISEETSLDISEIIQRLENNGFEIVGEIPSVISPGETITINVDHKVNTETVSQKTEEYTRTIKYVKADGTKAFDDVVQTLTAVTPSYEKKTDAVNGKDLTVYPEVSWPDGNVFAEVTSPSLDEYKPDMPKVNSEEALEKQKTVTVTYTEMNKDSIKFIFNDTDSDKQDLSEYSKTYIVSEGKTAAVDLSEEVTELEGLHYIINSEIPDTVSYTGESRQITIDVSHEKETVTGEESEKELRRTVSYKFSDGSKAAEPVEQTLTYVTKSESYILDKVTDNKEITENKSSWFKDDNDTFAEIISPEIEGYTADTVKVDSMQVSNPETFEDITINVTYNEIPKIKTWIKYVDINSKARDLSEYNTYVEISEPIAIEDFEFYTSKLIQANYVFVGDEVSVINPGEDITLNFDHKIEETTIPNNDKTYKRTILYTYEDGTKAAEDVVQTLIERVPSYTQQKDMVTNEIISSVPEKTWPNGTVYTSVDSPEISGYTPDKGTVESKDVDTTKPSEIVTVTYKKEAVASSIVFTDINSNPQDLGSYTLTYNIANQIPLNISETLSDLEDKGFEIVSDIPAVINPGENLTINVDHIISEEKVDEKTETYTRTIKYVYTNDSQASEPIVQTISKVTPEYTIRKDKVTNEDLTVYPETTWPSGTVFPEVYSPSIDGFKADINKVEEEAPAESEKTVTVTYTPVERISYVKFVDINADKQNLDDYTITMSLTEEFSLDVTSTVEELTGKNYVIVSDIPTTIKPNETVTINVDHKIDDSHVDSVTETFTRTINYKGLPDELSIDSVIQTILRTTPAYNKNIDTVTNKDYTVYPEAAWDDNKDKFEAVSSPSIDGYKPDKAMIEEEAPTEHDIVVDVTYYEYSPVEIISVTVSFEDINEDATSIEPITFDTEKGKAINENETFAAKMAELQNQGYELISGTDSIADGEPITVSVNHKTSSETTSEQKTMTRNIHRIMDDVENDVVPQNCNIVETTTKKIDSVTKKELESITKISGIMPEYDTSVENWTADRAKIESYDFANGYEGFVSDEYVKYTKTMVSVTIRFADINTDKTDTSKYSFTKSVPAGEKVDITEDVENVENKLKEAGYKVHGNIPSKIDSSSPEVTINVDHETSTVEEEKEVEFVRNIKLNNTTVKQQALAMQVTPVTTDKVTQKVTRGTPSLKPIEGKTHVLEKYVIHAVSGYTVSPSSVPEVDVLKNFVSQDTTIEVKYTKSSSGKDSSDSKPSQNNNQSNSGNTSNYVDLTIINNSNNSSYNNQNYQAVNNKPVNNTNKTGKTTEQKKNDNVVSKPEEAVKPVETKEPETHQEIKPTSTPDTYSATPTPDTIGETQKEDTKFEFNWILVAGLAGLAGVIYGIYRFFIIPVDDDDDDDDEEETKK